MTNLSIEKPVDENLKVVKSNDENTSLSLSKEGNGARIDGDLDVTGSYKGPVTVDSGVIKSDNDIDINSAGDINLDAIGGDVHFSAGGISYLNWQASGTLTMKAVFDTDDYLSFTIGNNGIAGIETNDDTGGNLADFTLDIEGDITLNSKNGNFIQENNGTEFSPANSAYAGMILGYTSIGLNEAPNIVALTTSYVVPTDEFSVTFVAPPSGQVEISIQIGFLMGSTGIGELYAGLSDANATSGYNAARDYHEKLIQYRGWRQGRNIVTHSWTETGLTAGNAYEYWVGFKSTTTTGTPAITYGGDSTGENVEFIMKAVALPATITT